MTIARWAAASTALLVLVSAACSGGDGGDPSPTPGGDVTFAPGSTIPANVTPVDLATTYPVTLTDMLFREVTIESAPERVAALSATAVEYVYAVGGTSVTRPAGLGYPPEAMGAADVGDPTSPDLDAVRDQDPDLIIADSALHPQLVESLEAIGVPVLYVGAPTLLDVTKGLQLVGTAVNRPAAAQKSMNGLENQLMGLSRQVPDTQPRTLMLLRSDDRWFAATAASYAGDLVALLGAQNVATGEPGGGPAGFTPITVEEIAALQPDVLLTVVDPVSSFAPAAALTSDAALDGTPAVRDGRVIDVSADLFVYAPGPRAGEALDALARALYPELFE
jgi:iron complex transport system substrate-binding protein